MFGNYKINAEKAKSVIQNLLKENHEKGYVKEIKVKDITFDISNKNVVIHVIVNVKFTPLIFVGNKAEYEFDLKENTRISLLKYN